MNRLLSTGVTEVLRANLRAIEAAAHATVPRDVRAVGAVAKADADQIRALREAEGEEEAG